MPKPQTHPPRSYRNPVTAFGDPRAGGAWVLPDGGTLEELRAAIVQHHAAAQLRLQLRRKDLTQRGYAVETGQHEQRLSTVLSGASGMQIYDIGNAAILGSETLPSADRITFDVQTYGLLVQRPRPAAPRPPRPDLGAIGFDPGPSGLPDMVLTVNVEREPEYTPEQLAAEARVADALKPVLTEVLAAVWPEAAARSVDIWARTVGFYSLSADAFEGPDGVVAHAIVDPDWDTHVLEPGHAVIDGVFVLRVLERDNRGRPVACVGLRRCLDLGTLCLAMCEFDVSWDVGGPQLGWRQLLGREALIPEVRGVASGQG